MLVDRPRLVDRAHLRAVPQSERLGELGEAIGVERHVAEALQSGDDVIGQGAASHVLGHLLLHPGAAPRRTELVPG